MGLFDFIKGPDINKGIEEFNNTPNAILLDVRTQEEYRQRYIPQSINIPVQNIKEVENVIEDKDTPILVYCLSGTRAGQAVDLLKAMGYENAKNIGGISTYRGKILKK